MKKILAVATLSGLMASQVVVAAENHEFKAHLTALNADKIGSSPVGDATFKVNGDELVIHIRMNKTPPGIQHWEHFHGKVDGTAATCATVAQDANKDGYIDLAETESVSGTTMVPFNDAPHKMDIPTDTYPVANKDGSFNYTKVVPLNQLESKFGEIFKGKTIDLDKRVIYVHGVPANSKLFSSVAGEVGHYGTDVTLPIACGEIKKVK